MEGLRQGAGPSRRDGTKIRASSRDRTLSLSPCEPAPEPEPEPKSEPEPDPEPEPTQVNEYFLGDDAARFSVVSFATDATTRVSWSYNTAVINAGIDQMTAKGQTSISDGFEAARQLFAGGGRKDATKIMLFISDGDQTVDAATGKTLLQTSVDAAALVKGDGVTVFAWGFGTGVKESTLQSIATDPSNAFLANDLAALTSHLVELAADICNESPPSLPPSPPPLSPPTPPAPPCTVEMLKQRAAGDKSWPIACSDTTLGTADKELDLSGAHLSYGDFKDARFTGAGAIKLNGAGLANADLSGSKLTADGGFGNALIDLGEADLTNADLSSSELTAITTGNYGASTIDFTEATLDQADMSGSTLTANNVVGLSPSPPTPPPSPQSPPSPPSPSPSSPSPSSPSPPPAPPCT
eukprot:scaffold59475_cov68-Phaeocystis_antarctica.AAC.1